MYTCSKLLVVHCVLEGVLEDVSILVLALERIAIRVIQLYQNVPELEYVHGVLEYELVVERCGRWYFNILMIACYLIWVLVPTRVGIAILYCNSTRVLETVPRSGSRCGTRARVPVLQ